MVWPLSEIGFRLEENSLNFKEDSVNQNSKRVKFSQGYAFHFFEALVRIKLFVYSLQKQLFGIYGNWFVGFQYYEVR